jgi:hypothetical protein
MELRYSPSYFGPAMLFSNPIAPLLIEDDTCRNSVRPRTGPYTVPSGDDLRY